MFFGPRVVPPYLGLECIGNRAGGAAKNDGALTGKYLVNMQPVIRQPGRYLLQVCLSNAILRSKLLGRQEVMILCGLRIILRGDQLCEKCLLRRITFQIEDHAFHRSALVYSFRMARGDQGMCITAQCDSGTLVDEFCYSGAGLGQRRLLPQCVAAAAECSNQSSEEQNKTFHRTP